MSKFDKTHYLELLRKQVEEEITYLVNTNHDRERNELPCIFCAPRTSGYYVCNRLADLRRFQESIKSHRLGDWKDSIKEKLQRREIGKAIEISPEFSQSEEPIFTLLF